MGVLYIMICSSRKAVAAEAHDGELEIYVLADVS